jgi:hypothetical protein
MTTTLLIALATVALMASMQTFFAMLSTQNGAAVGLHILGIPFDLVLALSMLPFGYLAVAGAQREVALGLGFGGLGSYAATWARAFGFVVAKWKMGDRQFGGDPQE